MFPGMYVAFLIAYTAFIFHADNIDSRVGLSVGLSLRHRKHYTSDSLCCRQSRTRYTGRHSMVSPWLFIFPGVTSSADGRVTWFKKNNKLSQANRFAMITCAGIAGIVSLLLKISFLSAGHSKNPYNNPFQIPRLRFGQEPYFSI